MNTLTTDLLPEQSLKRSFIIQPYYNQNLSAQNRHSTLKRSSITVGHSQTNTSDNPKTPRSNLPPHLENYSNSNSNQTTTSHFHQSNYGNVKYQSPQIPLQQLSTNRVQVFNIQQKKYKQPSLQEIIKQLSQKLQKTISHVQRHQILLKNNQNNSYHSHPNNKSFLKFIIETINDQTKLKETQINHNYNSLKAQIQNVKYEINKYIQKNQTQNKFLSNQSINKSIQNISKQLINHLTQITDNQTKCMKKQIDKIKQHVELQLSTVQTSLQDKIKKDKIQPNKLNDTIISCRAFLGDPLLVKYITKVAISLKSQTKQLQQSQIIYKIDNDGFLLDVQGKYILNSNYQQMKLSPQQIDLIRVHGFIR